MADKYFKVYVKVDDGTAIAVVKSKSEAEALAASPFCYIWGYCKFYTVTFRTPSQPFYTQTAFFSNQINST